MKHNGLILIVLGTLFFLVFKFIVVKIAYFKYPRDKSFNNLWVRHSTDLVDEVHGRQLYRVFFCFSTVSNIMPQDPF